MLLVLDVPTAKMRSARPRSSRKASAARAWFRTKLDGTAKGGVVVAVRQTMKLPIKFIGVGEALEKGLELLNSREVKSRDETEERDQTSRVNE